MALSRYYSISAVINCIPAKKEKRYNLNMQMFLLFPIVSA